MDSGKRTHTQDRALERLIGDERLVIDPASGEAHLLRGAAAAEWQAGREAGTSRRDLLRRAGTVAAAGTVITILMPEVMAAASTGTVPVPTTTNLSGPTSALSGQSLTLNVLVTADDPSVPVPAGSVTVSDPDQVAGAQGSTSFVATNGTASFTFAIPATAPASPDRFTAVFTPTDQLAYTGSSDFQDVTYTQGQPTKTNPTITFSAPNTNNKATWNLTVTVTGSGGHSPTGTLALASTTKGLTISPASRTLTAGTNSASSATFSVTNPSANKARTVTLKATYTPAAGDLYYNGTSQPDSYTSR